jgi:iron complex outermembrane recepter protein
MIMKTCNLLFICLLISGIATAQYSLRGKITDNQDGSPIPGVAVYLGTSMTGTITDVNGEFSFKRLLKGRYILKTHLLGYKNVEREVLLEGDTAIIFSLAKSSYMQDEVVVTSTRADEKSAMAYTILGKRELDAVNTGKDIPFLISSTPSVVTTSDAGTGIGYTGIRIRGSDATRINVTVNGIPINDAESQGMYWVDLPDLASSIDNIQIQRGAGTSTNGAGAFGGSINILTLRPAHKPFATSSNAFGSFNTIKNNVVVGTGILENNWNFEGRLSKITSDGYVDRASSDLKSFYFSGGYYGKKDLFKVIVFSGKEITYQSWYGVPEAALDTNRTWNFYTYDNQVDDYQQDNYQVHYSRQLLNKLIFNSALHYTRGKGFYEEYREQENLADYLLDDVIAGDDTITMTDLIRRKWLDNDFYGATWSLHYEDSAFSVILGGGWNQYDGDHFGEVIWSQYASNGNIRHQYYNNNGLKTDFNSFVKIIFDPVAHISVFGDIQYRRISYNFSGLDENLQEVPQNDAISFINPKAGITYTVRPGVFGYISLSVAGKEPSRDDYVDNPENTRPVPERLYDLEAGYHFQENKFRAGINYFRMMYDNQLVVTGKLNDVGNPVRVNVKNSYREGVELEGAWLPVPQVDLKGNVTVSRNKIKKFEEIVFDYDSGEALTVDHKDTDIAFSPGLTAYLDLSVLPLPRFRASLINRYTGKQYLDNTSDPNRQLDAYYTTDLRVSYEISPKFIRGINLTFTVHNLFDYLYESNGYTFSYIYGAEKYTENYYYPQAGRHFMGQVTLMF